MTATGKPLTVLLVEDDQAHAELIIRGLEDHRIANTVVHVSDGEQALDYLEGRGKFAGDSNPLPHVVFLDLRLPKLDGFEVLSQIRKSPVFGRLPVVVLSTSGAERDVARAYDAHVNSYIVKPTDYSRFAALIDDMGSYWLEWNCRAEPVGQQGKTEELH